MKYYNTIQSKLIGRHKKAGSRTRLLGRGAGKKGIKQNQSKKEYQTIKSLLQF